MLIGYERGGEQEERESAEAVGHNRAPDIKGPF